MSQQKPTFGALLRRHRRNCRDPERGGMLTQERFLDELTKLTGVSYPNNTLSRWEKDVRKIPFEDRLLQTAVIQLLHKYNGLKTLATANTLLAAGSYRDLSPEEIEQIAPHWQQDDPKTAPAPPPDPSPSNIYIDQRQYHGPVTQQGDIIIQEASEPPTWFSAWAKATFALDNIDDHLATSWQGKAIHLLSQMGNRLTWYRTLAIITAVSLWMAASHLLLPLWQWPLDDELLRRNAAIRYAIGSLLIPLLIAIVTPQDPTKQFKTKTSRAKWLLFQLKLTGSLVAFGFFATIIFLPILILHYILAATLPTWLGSAWAGIVILWCHIVAQRIPADRHKMFDGQLRSHEADPLFLIVFLFFGCSIAWFVYTFYWFLTNATVGYLLLLTLAGIALWEARKRDLVSLTERQTAVILGFAFPIGFIALLLFVTQVLGDLRQLAAGTYLAVALTVAYLVAYISQWIVLLLRNPPTMTLRGMFTFLAILFGLGFLLELNLTAGRITAVLLLLLWLLGHRQIAPWFKFHPSFWLTHLTISLSLIAETTQLLPLWLNLLLFISTTSLLIQWTWQQTDQPNTRS